MNLKFKMENFPKIRFKKPKISTIFVIIMFLGMILGAFSIGFISTNVYEKINEMFLNTLKIKNAGFNNINFIYSFANSLFFLLLIFISSLSFFGSIIIFLIIFLKGFGIGLLSGYIYTLYLIKGIFFCSVILFPGLFISSLGFIILSIHSLNFSNKFASKILPNSSEEHLWPEFLIYTKKLSLAIFIFVLSSFIDFILTGLMYHLFNF